MDVRITKKNGETFTFEEYKVIARDFIVSSIPLDPVYGQLEGRHGFIDYGATYRARPIKVPFYMDAYDLGDYPLLRDFLFSMVLDTESFYIQELRRGVSDSNQLVGGKRYLVRLQNTFEIEQILNVGLGELIFETTELPFAESIGTTQDIQLNGISSESELWGFGMGLIANDEALKYTHTGTSFRIFNAGNVPVHPFEQYLKITISEVQGSTSYLELKNETNGSLFRVNEAVTNAQKIVIDGPNITSNGLQFLRKTNKGFIELEPGWNDFTIKGAIGAKVEFDFRFYYK